MDLNSEDTTPRQPDENSSADASGAAGAPPPDQGPGAPQEQPQGTPETGQPEGPQAEVLHVDLDDDEVSGEPAWTEAWQQQQAPPQARPAQPAAPTPVYAAAGPQTQPPAWSYQPPPAAPPQPPRKMSGCIIALLVGLGILVIGALVSTLFMGMLVSGESAPHGIGTGGDKIALIHVSGTIQDGGEQYSIFGTPTFGARTIMSQLRQAGDDPSVKAVLLRINSPGGSAAASQAIYTEVVRVQKEKKKPVIASMGDVAASGGYYIASPADIIVASPATLTGSIGVIMESLNWSGLAEKYGVKAQTFVSGPNKDGLNPFRAMREDERQLFQSIVNDVYDQFVTDVAKGRKKLSKAQVKKLADGRAYTGRQAKKVGLVDELGNYHESLAIAAKAAGIKGEPSVKTYGKPHGLYALLSEKIMLPNMQSPVDQMLPSRSVLGPGIWLIWEGDQTLAGK